MEWVRGEIIGRGSFGTVNLAIPRRDCREIPPLIAVKSGLVSQSSMLQKEKEILSHLSGCPQILRCFGDDLTVENGEKVYNVFLELASKGNLFELLKKSGGVMNESDVRRYTRSILRGLRYIHEKDYVHCDIKLQNILVCSSPDGRNDVKIADFGLAKKAGQKKNSACGDFDLIGTPLYMSPESVACNEHEAPSDIWALGCVVAEMISGKPAWRCSSDTHFGALLFRIGSGEEVPEIPEDLSEEGKDFLRRCFVKDPTKRWTAEMLLNHPFIGDDTVTFDEDERPSPRSAFDFPDWSSSQSSLLSSISPSTSHSYTCFEAELDKLDCCSSSSVSSTSPTHRIRELAMAKLPNWFSSESWATVRQADSPVSQLEKTEDF